MKTQIFTTCDKIDLQMEIDEFLDHHSVKELIDIKFSTCADEDSIFYSAMVLYKT